MGGWLPQSPWKIIAGSGQSLANAGGASSKFANAVGTETRAIAISLAPTATPTAALVTVTHGGSASTASTDLLVKTTDPPFILGVSPGDQVTVWGLAAVTAYLTELTH
jgi:hypothetical protein